MSLLDARRAPPLTFAREPRSPRALAINPERRMRHLALGLLVAGASACGGGAVGRGPRNPSPAADDVPAPASTTSIYRGVGRLAAGDPLPFVGTLAFAAGAGDTALALLGSPWKTGRSPFSAIPSGSPPTIGWTSP